MSRLGDLVATACPDGVEFQALGALLAYEQPGKYLVATKNYDPAYPTSVLTAGQSFLLGYTSETEGVYPASAASPVIIFDDFTTASKWVDFPFKAKSSAMKMLTAKDGDPITLRYVFHAMQTLPYEPQEHTRQWIATYSQLPVPWPPEDVRREIVRVLDTFQGFGTTLEAELTQRRIQMAYYRERLMRFIDVANVEWQPMGEIGRFVRGRRFTKADYVDEGGVGCIHYGEIYTHYGASATATISRVRAEMSPNLRFAEKGDVIIATVGETVEEVGKAVAWLGDEAVAYHDDSCRFRSDMNPKFVAYLMQTAAFHAQKNPLVSRGKMNRISGSDLEKIMVPVPRAEEQKRVVAILDAFDALIHDPNVGLPAEIGARRRQFEYYRDRLLTFEGAVG